MLVVDMIPKPLLSDRSLVNVPYMRLSRGLIKLQAFLVKKRVV